MECTPLKSVIWNLWNNWHAKEWRDLRLEELWLSSLEKTGGPNSSCTIPTGKLSRRWSRALHSSAWWDNKINGCRLKKERFQRTVERKLFSRSSSGAGCLACPTCDLGGFQDPCGQSPEPEWPWFFSSVSVINFSSSVYMSACNMWCHSFSFTARCVV